MGPRLVVVADVLLENPPEMVLAEDDQVVHAFAPDRADDSLSVGVLPGGLRGGNDLLKSRITKQKSRRKVAVETTKKSQAVVVRR